MATNIVLQIEKQGRRSSLPSQSVHQQKISEQHDFPALSWL